MKSTDPLTRPHLISHSYSVESKSGSTCVFCMDLSKAVVSAGWLIYFEAGPDRGEPRHKAL